MMQKKDFLYFLTDKDGRCYKLDGRGKIIINNIVKPLINTPDGWQDKMINYSRDKNYKGMMRSFTIPLKFVTDGAKIIRYLFYNYGIQAECCLRIAKLNRSTGNHESYYIGSLDFSTFEDDKSGMYVQINVLDSGLAAIIKNKETTKYEVPIGQDANDQLSFDPRKRVMLDGIALKGSFYYTSLLDKLHGIPGGSIGVGVHWIDAIYVNQEGHFVNIEHQNVSFKEIDDMNAIRNSNRWVLNTTVPITFTLKLDYTISVSPALEGAQAYATIWAGTSSVTTDKQLSDHLITGTSLSFTDYSGVKEVDITLAAGENLYIFTDVWSGAPPGSPGGRICINYKKFDLNISGVTRERTTFCYAVTPSFLFDRVIHKISGQSNNTKSDLLKANDDNTLYKVLITTGNAIRRLDNAIIKTTFQDLFKAYNVIWNTGFSVENEKAVLEELQYFYQKDVVEDLGDVSNLKISPDKENMYNLIDVGYAEQDYDNVNGKDEFNNTSEFSTPITRINEKLDLVCPWRADMYGVEFTRIDFDGKNTTDSSSDDDIFFLVVSAHVYTDEDGEYYKLYRPQEMSIGGQQMAVISGVISPSTAFNTLISPKHLLGKHGNYIHAMLDKMDADKIKFHSTNKNADLTISYATFPGRPRVIISENSDVDISSLADKIYLPYIIEFDTQIPKGTKKIFDETPKGLVSFTWKGEKYNGFILDCNIKPAFNESQTWKLLCGPNNDLRKLING